MLTLKERARLHDFAILPEQVPEYVEAVTGAEPFLFGDFAGYRAGGTLVLVGYPLEGAFDEETLRREMHGAVARLGPDLVSLLAPTRPSWLEPSTRATPDHYYRLRLEGFEPGAKLRNTIRRAGRELTVTFDDRMSDPHRRLIHAFLASRTLSPDTRKVFEGIPKYVDSVASCFIVSARDTSGRIEAFSILETGARDVAFYMFNFRAPEARVPGASDLLLSRMVAMARESGKAFLNLGLGVHSGVEFFKRKWGAVPFAACHHFVFPASKRSPWKSLLRALAGL